MIKRFILSSLVAACAVSIAQSEDHDITTKCEGRLASRDNIVPVDSESLSPEQRKFWQKVKKISPEFRKVLDARIERGELTQKQMDAYLDFLWDRTVLSTVFLSIPSFAWSHWRDFHHLQDTLSMHQSNFMRGISVAMLFEYYLRKITRNDSGRVAILACALLGLGNLVNETPLLSSQVKWDPADLFSGGIGVLVYYAIHRLNEHQFRIKYQLINEPEPDGDPPG